MNLRHLARLAGLSASAVSLALRDSPKISTATKAAVRQLAQKHGYKPDAKVVALMTHLRKPPAIRQEACFGVVSFYNHPRPWETSRHLTRIYEGMNQRATELGYRLEPLWLRAPGMTYRRLRGILDARGIEGLLCFGSPDLEQVFPDELASYAIVTIGSMTGAGKDAVDAARERGEKVGLVKVKTYRPFPVHAIVDALATVEAVGVVDRSVSYGWNCGPVFQDVIGALQYAPRRVPAMSFIGGLSGSDLTIGHFDRVIRRTAELARSATPGETVWINEND